MGLDGGGKSSGLPGYARVPRQLNRAFIETIDLLLREPLSVVLHLVTLHSCIGKNIGNVEIRVVAGKELEIYLNYAAAVGIRTRILFYVHRSVSVLLYDSTLRR